MQSDPPKADPPKRKRRWFQFSLRTLMIGVALLAVPCGYLEWQAKIVRERRAFCNSHIGLYDFYDTSPRHRLPWLRKILGDDVYCVVALPIESPKAERALVAEVFPEAEILAINPRNPNGTSGGGGGSMTPFVIPFPDEAR
jgi:hypothetical protein